jgi:hypothetical protein
MEDYSKYPYQRLLEYIDKKVQQRGADTDLVEYLLTMEHADSIEELVEIYNNTFKNLAILFFDSESLPYNWYDVRTWGYQKEFILTELNYCFNENLFKWFKKQIEPSKELVKKCIFNLRDNENRIEIDEELIKAIPDNDDNIEFYSIRNEYLNLLHNNIKNHDYKHCIKIMAGCGRIFDAYEVSYGESTGIVFDKLAEEYNHYLELKKKKEFERQRKAKEEKRKKIIAYIVSFVFLVIFFVLLDFILKKIGGIIGVIIIIGFLGAIPKLFLTGKF